MNGVKILVGLNKHTIPIEGRSKPKDPIIYFMFAEMLEVGIVDVMNAYSTFDLSTFKTREALPLKENESEIKLTNKYSNW